KCNITLGLINRHFMKLPKPNFLILYKSLVRSKIEYAASVWSPWSLKVIEDIERATRIVKNCIGFNYEQRLRLLDLPTLRYRRIR
ncbi:hypothetical protein HELRODRAFT_137362, partial [Helobdella robusta]|uniref:Uncharacterized protein n=1 Tax=Helobdella robusta TaxID=6412 RepID=T1EIK0_HELRO